MTLHVERALIINKKEHPQNILMFINVKDRDALQWISGLKENLCKAQTTHLTADFISPFELDFLTSQSSTSWRMPGEVRISCRNRRAKSDVRFNNRLWSESDLIKSGSLQTVWTHFHWLLHCGRLKQCVHWYTEINVPYTSISLCHLWTLGFILALVLFLKLILSLLCTRL